MHYKPMQMGPCQISCLSVANNVSYYAGHMSINKGLEAICSHSMRQKSKRATGWRRRPGLCISLTLSFGSICF